MGDFSQQGTLLVLGALPAQPRKAGRGLPKAGLAHPHPEVLSMVPTIHLEPAEPCQALHTSYALPQREGQATWLGSDHRPELDENREETL